MVLADKGLTVAGEEVCEVKVRIVGLKPFKAVALAAASLINELDGQPISDRAARALGKLIESMEWLRSHDDDVDDGPDGAS